MKAHKGFFFSFEGNEGSGKSTQIALLAERLEQEGFVVSQWEGTRGNGFGRGTSPHHQTTRRRTENGAHGRTPADECQSWAQLVEEVIFACLNQGEIILVDRFYDSTLVYQGLVVAR